MTSPSAASFLDFFVLEASEYVEQLDGLVARAADAAPDAVSLQRLSRALRGSATMAKLPSFAEVASALEAIGRALREGGLGWDIGLKAAVTAAIDDLKILVRAARSWSPAEDEWARKRVAELSAYVPEAAVSQTPAVATGTAYFVSEMNSIADGLELVTTRPDDRDAAINVLRRVRALRGVAGVRDVPALSEVTEAAETAARPMELGELRLSDERVNLLRSAAELMRTISSGLSSGDVVTSTTPQYTGFLAALDAMLADVSSADRVIPIDQLFYDDAGPYVVSAAPNPPTTAAQRFRMEVVSLGEHLHRVIDEARAATEDIQREHARGELGRALRAIRATAASFSQMSVAQTVEAYLERTGDLDAAALDAISHFAESISPASSAPTPVAQPAVPPLRMSQARSAVAALGGTGARLRPTQAFVRPAEPLDVPAPPHTPPPPPAPALPAQRAPQAAAPDQHARVFAAVPKRASAPTSLDDTIAAFESLSNERLAEPAPLEDDVIPVDALVYRGRAALDRAVELRDALRRSAGPPSPEVLEELYDLVELARVD